MRLLSSLHLRHLSILIAAAILPAACSQSDSGPLLDRARAPLQAQTAPDSLRGDRSGRELVLPWGNGPNQVGFRPASPGTLPEGPSAVALLPGGGPVVLDRLNARVLKLDPEGGAVTALGARPDDELLAADADGTLALFSPLRASVLVYDPSNKQAGELRVARELRDVQSLSFGTSRRILVRTAFQETFDVGSPHAPATLEASLQSKREGVVFLPDGRGVAVWRSQEGRIELQVLGAEPSSGRTRVDRRLQVASHAASARLLGAAGSTVCLRIERVSPAPLLAVSREAICVDAAAADVTLRQPLPAPGLYVPAGEMAMGQSPPRLAMLHPRVEGLAVVLYDSIAPSTTGGTP